MKEFKIEKKISYKNSKGQSLVAIVKNEGLDQVVIMCHGFMSSKYSKGRFDRLADALTKMGISTFAFDFAGCGESDDEIITVANHIRDLNDTINFVKSKGYKHIILMGHSLGSLICLKADQSHVSKIVLTGALTGPMIYDWTDYFTSDQLDEIKLKGHTLEESSEKGRDYVAFSQETLDDFADIDQEVLMSNIQCPLLIIHGNGDPEEAQLYAHSLKSQKYLKCVHEVYLIDGAEHNFLDHYDQVIDKICHWLK